MEEWKKKPGRKPRQQGEVEPGFTKKGRRIDSRRKGKRGELEVAKLLRETFGWDARRRNQFTGGEGRDDVSCGFDGIHLEVKLAQKWVINEWMEQAWKDSNYGHSIPVVVHRKNRVPWVAIWPNQFTDRLMTLLETRVLGDKSEQCLHAFREMHGEPKRGHVWDMLKPVVGSKALVTWSTGDRWTLTACLLTDWLWVPKLRRFRNE